MQRRHTLLADGIGAGEGGLRLRNSGIVEMGNQTIGGAPGFIAGFTNDNVQTDAEAYLASLRRRFGAHLFNLLFYQRRRFAPGEVDVDLFSGEILRRFGGAAEPERRTWLLHWVEQQARAAHLHILAGVIDRFALQDATPDAGKLRRLDIALMVVEKDAVARQLFRIAAGHQIEQRAAVREAIQRRGLARRLGRRNHTGAQRHQKAQALRYRDQRGGHQPGVFARATGRDQHAAEAQTVSGLRDLLQIAVVDRARPF